MQHNLKNIFVIRHCSAIGQNENDGLTLEGANQSRALCDFLGGRGIEHIVSSPSARAKETIAPFAVKNEIEVIEDPRLRERVLSTHSLDDWLSRLEESFLDRNLRVDEGETSNEAAERSYEVVMDLLGSKFQNMALVTHGNLMALILGRFDNSIGFKEWANLTNPDVYLIRTDGNRHEVQRIWG